LGFSVRLRFSILCTLVFSFDFSFYPKPNQSTEATKLFTNPTIHGNSRMAHVMQEAAHRKPIAPALPSASGAPKPHAPHTSIPYPILSLCFQNPIPHGHTRGHQGGASGGESPALSSARRPLPEGPRQQLPSTPQPPSRHAACAHAGQWICNMQLAGEHACGRLTSGRIAVA
jgi:hypothetical protein